MCLGELTQPVSLTRMNVSTLMMEQQAYYGQIILMARPSNSMRYTEMSRPNPTKRSL